MDASSGAGVVDKDRSQNTTKVEKIVDRLLVASEQAFDAVVKIKRAVQRRLREFIRKDNYRLNLSYLHKVGLTEEELSKLGFLMSVQGNKAIFENDFIFVMMALSIIDSGEKEFFHLIDKHYYENVRAVGIMICQILFHNKVLDKAKRFLDTESLNDCQTRFAELLRDNLKTKTSRGLVNVIHMISNCGDHTKEIIPNEIDILVFHSILLDKLDLIALANVISHSRLVRRMSFFGCGVTSASLKTLRTGLIQSNIKVLEFDFSRNKNMDVKGFGHIGAIVKHRGVDKLELRSCDIQPEEMESFHKEPGHGKICSIILNNNREMGKAGLRYVGAIVRKNGVDSLDLEDCGLNAGEIKALDQGAGEIKISAINLKGNQTMGNEGLRHVGAFVKHHSVSKLKLNLCQLQAEDVKAFDDGAGKAKISEINFSGNQNLGVAGFGCAGAIVQHHGVDKLDLSFCALQSEGVESLKNGTENAQLHELDVSNNELGIAEAGIVGEFVAKSGVQKLNMSRCGLYSDHFESFTTKLGETKIKELDVSNQKRSTYRDEKFLIKPPCSLLNHVTECLNLSGNDLKESEISVLRDFLDYAQPSNIKILIGHQKSLNPELESKLPLTKEINPNVNEGASTSKECRKTEEMSEKSEQLTSATTYDSLLQVMLTPMEKVVENVGSEGKKISVGGCSVDFPKGAFEKNQVVTIIARIDPTVLPAGEKAITPILTVSAKNLKELATITLSTWCTCENEDDDPQVEVLRFSTDNKTMDVIHACKLGNSNSIVFKRSHFCNFFARFMRYFSPPVYSIAPAIYISRQEYIFALVKDTPLAIKALKAAVKKDYRQFQTFEISSMTLKNCREQDEVKLMLTSDVIELRFNPSQLDTNVKVAMESNTPWYSSSSLEGKSPADFFTFQISLVKNGKIIQDRKFHRLWKTGAPSLFDKENVEWKKVSADRNTMAPNNSLKEDNPRNDDEKNRNNTFTKRKMAKTAESENALQRNFETVKPRNIEPSAGKIQNKIFTSKRPLMSKDEDQDPNKRLRMVRRASSGKTTIDIKPKTVKCLKNAKEDEEVSACKRQLKSNDEVEYPHKYRRIVGKISSEIIAKKSKPRTAEIQKAKWGDATSTATNHLELDEVQNYPNDRQLGGSEPVMNNYIFGNMYVDKIRSGNETSANNIVSGNALMIKQDKNTSQAVISTNPSGSHSQ